MGPLLGPPQTVEAQVGSAEVNGVALRYEIEGTGEPLVLIHGFPVHRDYWDGTAEVLAREYTVIRYDRRGFGESGGKHDLTADAADLKALLETLGHPRAHVMGHSQGSAVALTFALRYPDMVRGLILFGAVAPVGFGVPDPGRAQGEELARIARAYGVDSVKAVILAGAGQLLEDRPDLAERGRALLEAYHGLELIEPDPPSNLAEPARMDELGGISTPTLVLNGEDEMPFLMVVADSLAVAIPGAQRVVIPGAGHWASWTEPERFEAEVLRFLRRSEGDRGRKPQRAAVTGSHCHAHAIHGDLYPAAVRAQGSSEESPDTGPDAGADAAQ